MVMLKRKIKYFFATILTIMSLCGFMCHPDDDEWPVAVLISEHDCVDHFRYIVDVHTVADSMRDCFFYGDSLLYCSRSPACLGHGCTQMFGPVSYLGIFDTLTLTLSVFCNDQWLESRDYKFLNRKDAFMHIDYKEQAEGELMFDAELDSICPGLSNYRITQYTDTECLEELNSK